MREQWMAMMAMAAMMSGSVLGGCPGDIDIDGDDDDDGGAQPPFDLDALSCEHDFVNERLGGLHYWLLDLQPDGTFEANFPSSPGDTVSGTYDEASGALSATVTFDEGYKITGEEVTGTVTFESNGDMTADTTVTLTYVDGFVELQERSSQQVGCTREVEYGYVDRRGDAIAVSVLTTATGAMTAEETVDADMGGHSAVHIASQLNDDFSRDDAMEIDDLETEPSPDQELDRTILGDGSGSGTYVTQRDGGRVMTGGWDYYPDGDQEGDWEMEDPNSPVSPIAWGHTYNALDLSGSTEYTRLGPGGTEVHCTSEWDSEGHGATECDDGTYEEF